MVVKKGVQHLRGGCEVLALKKSRQHDDRLIIKGKQKN